MILPKHLEIEANIQPPKGSTVYSVPRGMMSWRNRKNGYTTLAIHFSADPEKDSLEWFEEETRQLRDDQIRREYLLDFSSRAGQRVFPYLEVTPDKWYVNKVGQIPKNWIIIGGMDFGGTNPTSIHLYAIDPRGRFHAFWEFYKPSTPSEIARVLKNNPYFNRIVKIVADPSIFNKNQHNDNSSHIKSLADMLADHGIHNLEKGINDRIAGLQRVKQMLRYSEFNKDLAPHLTISPDCPNLWRELNGLTYKEQTPEQLVAKNPDEDVVKKNDHAYDELRYALMSWNVPSDQEVRPDQEETCFKDVENEIDDRYRMEDGDRW